MMHDDLSCNPVSNGGGGGRFSTVEPRCQITGVERITGTGGVYRLTSYGQWNLHGFSLPCPIRSCAVTLTSSITRYKTTSLAHFDRDLRNTCVVVPCGTLTGILVTKQKPFIIQGRQRQINSLEHFPVDILSRVV